MILVADIGNTSITIGAYEDDVLVFADKLVTVKEKSCEKYTHELFDIIESQGISGKKFNGAVISSVVPEVTENFSKALTAVTDVEPIVVGEKHNGNLKVEILPVSYLGADLIAGCIGAISKYPLPCIVADLGTATKLLVINEKGYFCGCTISPGVKISLDALAEKASLLPSISLTEPERVIGRNTVECMQSGIVFGTAAMLDGLVSRMKKEMGEEQVTVVVTGGYSKEIASCCETEVIYDENLLLDGMKKIYNDAVKER